MEQLEIAPAMLTEIVAHLAAALPNEGCGLLATLPAGTGPRAVRFFPGSNIDRSPVRYTMDPRQVMDALETIEAQGWQLGAIVHSHPRTAAAPSPTDLREAYYPGALLLIVSFKDATPLPRAWRLPRDGDAATEVPIRATDAGALD